MFRSMPLSGSLAACLMIYGPHMPTKMCKQNLHSGWQNGNRIKRKREQPERLLSLFMYASFSWGHGVWNLAEWVRHWGNRSVRISGNKQIIRTHFPRGKSGSDYIGLVPLTGLEPVLNRFRWILSPLCLPIPSYPHILFFTNRSTRNVFLLRCPKFFTRCPLAKFRPRPRAQLASSAPGGARIASQFHHARIEKSLCFYSARQPGWGISPDPRFIKTGKPVLTSCRGDHWSPAGGKSPPLQLYRGYFIMRPLACQSKGRRSCLNSPCYVYKKSVI